VFLIWALERGTRIATETIIGVVFSAALAVGSLMSSGEELIEALFGGPGTLTAGEIIFGLTAAAGVVFFVWKKKDSLIPRRRAVDGAGELRRGSPAQADGPHDHQRRRQLLSIEFAPSASLTRGAL